MLVFKCLRAARPPPGNLTMAVESSLELPLGSMAPTFALPDTISGRTMKLADFATSRALLVCFLCNHCPYVIHIRKGLVDFAREAQPRGVAVVAISSNDAGAYPQDGPDKMQQQAREAGFSFPYLFDESQQVARAYHAMCTPEFYLFDSDQRLVYRGRFDESRPGGSKPVTGADLRAAVDALLTGQAIDADQKPSIGCSIKWKPGTMTHG
jgi:peroxiredoxin